MVEIDILKEELKEVKEGRAESDQQALERGERSLVKASVPSEEEEEIPSQSQGNKSPTPTPAKLSTKPHFEKQSSASVTVSKLAQIPEPS